MIVIRTSIGHSSQHPDTRSSDEERLHLAVAMTQLNPVGWPEAYRGLGSLASSVKAEIVRIKLGFWSCSNRIFWNFAVFPGIK